MVFSAEAFSLFHLPSNSNPSFETVNRQFSRHNAGQAKPQAAVSVTIAAILKKAPYNPLLSASTKNFFISSPNEFIKVNNRRRKTAVFFLQRKRDKAEQHFVFFYCIPQFLFYQVKFLRETVKTVRESNPSISVRNRGISS